MEIEEMVVYTSREIQEILKISLSTFTRLIKKRVLKATKIGGQYRILGKDLLQIISPYEQTSVYKKDGEPGGKIK